MIEPSVIDIYEATRENGFLLKVLLTPTKVQVAVMSLLPGEEIGSESHQGDQLLYAANGRGVAVLNDSNEDFEKGTMFCVPAGARHNVINTGGVPLKLFSIYAPPQHA
jgi:mannose-6-phosphate isomerase-like protein (cupin superfamily)